MNKYLLVITVLLFTLQSCVKDQTGFEPNSNIPLYTNDILGIIEDESGAPIEGVRVMYDGQEALTDIFGVYQFKNVKVSSDQSFLSIEKTGYFAAGRSFSSVGNGTIKLKNVLLSKTFNHLFDADKGGSISETNFTVLFPANALVDKLTNQAYNGQVKAAIRYINPTSMNALNQMPGTTTGLASTGAVVCLSNFGTIAIELEGIIGIPLKLSPDYTFHLKVDLPSQLTDIATSTSDIWYFDPALGYWRQHNSAALIGNSYEADLNQLNFITIANMTPSKIVSGSIVDDEGRPMPFTSVMLADKSQSFETKTYTDNYGRYSSKIPENLPIDLWINKNNDCESISNQKITIEPINKNTQISDVKFNLNNSKYYKIKGTLVSCSGKNIQSGYAVISTGNGINYILIAKDGKFEGYLYLCNKINEVSLIGINSESNERSITLSIPVSNEVNVGSIIVCKEEKDFVHIQIPQINLDTFAYSSIAFTDGNIKSLEASLPFNASFFGISWSDAGTKGVKIGKYNILPNKGYIALKQKNNIIFYKATSGIIEITEGASSLGKAFKGNFTLELQQDGRMQSTLANGNFKATY
ncbi:MAG: carboxypeptidase regulatory-like domain-containing protein [Saprospiraceae bacterium]|nr:carboxypeptidase regulatory-like domain-containing protein [Saprospiraceae bacterium]